MFDCFSQYLRNNLYVMFKLFWRKNPLRRTRNQSGANNHRNRVMRNFFSLFIKDESGATAIEYGLIASLISVAAIVAFSAVGTQLSAVFNFVAGQLST
jgi:pilus assembly protein Flp/PilA